MARTQLTADTRTTPASKFTTATIAPAPNRLVLVFVTNIRNGGGAAGVPSATGNSLAWTQVATIQVAGATDHRLTCFRALDPSPSAGGLTFDFGGEQQALCAWSIFEYDNIDLTLAEGAGAVAQSQSISGNGTTLSILLGPLADAAKSTVVGGIVAVNNANVNAGLGLTQIDQLTLVAGASTGRLQTEDRIGGGQNVGWSWIGPARACAIAIEVKGPVITIAPEDTETLARRFEPILVCDASERFFPSDAKHYLEQCALWGAESPFDDKDSWGGKGKPFPRSPLIDFGKIAGVAGEPGTALGPAFAVPATQETFFDLGGWKDASGTPQPKVTATSQNTYSNRDQVAVLYGSSGNEQLFNSRFWYHVEFFNSDQLLNLLSTVPAPDLVTVLHSLNNPALLCYYFFFPAHEEPTANMAPPLATTCTNVEAAEFNCFAGEWGCMAVLLERGDSDVIFNPSFIGFSGRLTQNATTAQVTDGNNFDKGLVMTVSPFSKAQAIAEHPRLFVSKGTHAFYLESGTKTLQFPADSAPYDCGLFEGDVTTPPSLPDTNPLIGAGIVLGKLVAGSAMFGAIGALAGFVWGAVEYVQGDYGGLGIVGTGTTTATATDTTADASTGIVVRPKGLAMPGANLQDWLSEQGLVAPDGRHYDFIVDRSTQLWWPGEFGQGGYQGRWGPRVETDPFARRAGMKFPAFWRLFFLAFAKGKAQGVL
jgi:hypothetical protein